MRKLLLTGIMSALSIFYNFGQNWYPVGAKWYFNEQLLFDYPAHGYTKYTVDKDTLINSMDAKKIIACTYHFNGDTSGSKALFLREEDSKIYKWNGADFELMYDLSLQAGDTLGIPVKIGFECDSVSPIVVDSIKEINTNGALLKVQYISGIHYINDHADLYTDMIIERIGRIQEFIYNPVCGMDIVPWETLLLRCYKDEDILYESGWWLNYMPGAPCDTLIDARTAIEKGQPSDQTIMYPNPARNLLFLECPSTPIQSVYIYNAEGKLIHLCEPLSRTFELETGHLPNGLYIIRILSDSFIESKILVKL